MRNVVPSIAVVSPSFCRNHHLKRELDELGLRVVYNQSFQDFDHASLVEFLRETEAEIAIVGREPVTAWVLERCPLLRFIAKYGVGLDNLDLAAIKQRGIGVGWTPGVNRRAVSELVVAYLLMHFRNIRSTMDQLNHGIWHKDGGTSLGGKKIGMVGFGSVGSDLAGLLRGFEVELLYCDIVDRSSEAAKLEARAVGYAELLATADVVSFHVPLTNDTAGMLGAREIATMKPSALVVNTSRGEVVDFSAVCQAVRDGRLGGFAADVFPQEPMIPGAEYAGGRFYFTPHIGGNSVEAVLAMGRAAIEVVRGYLASRIP